jgi:hypothetical protein
MAWHLHMVSHGETSIESHDNAYLEGKARAEGLVGVVRCRPGDPIWNFGSRWKTELTGWRCADLPKPVRSWAEAKPRAVLQYRSDGIVSCPASFPRTFVTPPRFARSTAIQPLAIVNEITDAADPPPSQPMDHTPPPPRHPAIHQRLVLPAPIPSHTHTLFAERTAPPRARARRGIIGRTGTGGERDGGGGREVCHG